VVDPVDPQRSLVPLPEATPNSGCVECVYNGCVKGDGPSIAAIDRITSGCIASQYILLHLSSQGASTRGVDEWDGVCPVQVLSPFLRLSCWFGLVRFGLGYWGLVNRS
jgi:hypothetical protein